MSCGSYDSDDSVGCVGNKEKKKDSARVSQQMQHVAKQFGSIGKSMGKKLKKNFGNIGKGMKNLDDKKSKKKSVGSVITQSTKMIASIATEVGKNTIWCARLTLQQSSIHADLLKNYMQDAETRFNKYREIMRKKNEEIKKRVPVYPASVQTCQSAVPGCHGPCVLDSSYQCKACYDLQKQQERSGSYHTFPRGKTLEGSTEVYGRSSKLCGDVTGSSCLPEVEGRSGRISHVDRQHSLSAGDVSYSTSRGRLERTPSPDYDNVEYSVIRQGEGRAVDQYGTHMRAPRTRCLNTGCDYVGHAQYSGLCQECYDRHTAMGYIVGKSHHIRL